MTQRYAHLRDEALRKASDLAGEIISGARTADAIEMAAATLSNGATTQGPHTMKIAREKNHKD
jgi:hypothetical protein